MRYVVAFIMLVYVLIITFIDVNKWINFILFGFINTVLQIFVVYDLYLHFPIVIFNDFFYIRKTKEYFFIFLFGFLSFLFFGCFVLSFYIFVKYDNIYVSNTFLGFMYLFTYLFVISLFFLNGFIDCSGHAFCEYCESNNNHKKIKKSFLPSSLTHDEYLTYRENPIVFH